MLATFLLNTYIQCEKTYLFFPQNPQYQDVDCRCVGKHAKKNALSVWLSQM